MSKQFRNSFTATIQGSEVRIDNYFNSYSYGFSHTSKLYIDCLPINSAVVGYIDRTWECYSYQTSATRAVENAITDFVETRKRYYKINHNIERMTKTHKERFAAELENNTKLSLLKEIKTLLAKSGCYCAPDFKVFYA